MMWDLHEDTYRGQASDGTVVTVPQPVMELALKKAGKGVYDSDWWVESQESILSHWGIDSRRWMDGVTRTPRARFTMSAVQPQLKGK